MKKILYIIAPFVFYALSVKSQVVGSNDLTFDPGSGAPSSVSSTAVQSDGKILAAGGFTVFNGATKNRLVRLNSDGSSDPAFSINSGFNSTVYKVGQLASGKIIACGQFTTCNGAAARRIIRLNANGTADNTFTVSTAANGFVYSFAEQADAKIIIGGGFTTFAGATRNRIARVNINGSNDATFTPGTGANSSIYSISLQNDGKVLIGGAFTAFNGTSIARLARLNSNGTLDGTFVTGTGITSTNTNVAVYACEVQSDGKILVGGLFSAYNGSTVNNIVRLNTDGTIDNSFSVAGFNNYVRSIKIQPDGKIIVAGAFTTYNGVAKNRIVRLNSDGTIDNTFNGTGSNSTILSSSLQSDGNIIISGDFTTYSGDARARIARINSICPTLTLSASQTDNLCNGGSSGSATVTAAGGSTYTYSWLPTNTTLSVSSGLSAGTYSCIVTNECSNSATVVVTITEPTSISVTTAPSATICLGSNTVITATASGGGSGSYTYNWMPGNLSGASQTVSPTSNTTYTVTSTDANGCNGTNTQDVSVSPLPTISISGGTTAICSGSSLTLTASGASSYNWSTGANTATVLVNPTSTTSYSVTGTDVNGCSNTASKTVTVSGSCAMTTVPCGITISNLSSTASAVNVTGATQYRFKFYNNTTNALVATKIQATRTLTFNSVSGIYYGNTYKWTVAVDKGTGFGAESNNNCTITFATPKTTVPCGNSYSNLNKYTTAQAISGIINYRFSFYNSSTNSLVAVKTQTSNYIYFNQVPGLAYGNTYKWTVDLQYNNGTSVVYGPASSNTCTITFNPPQTTVPCGLTYTSTAAYSAATAISGVSAYRFSFYDATTSALVAAKTNTNNYVYFNQIPGLIFNKAYKWTIEVQYYNGSSNVFGPPSSNTCTMTWGTPPPTIDNSSDTEASRFTQSTINEFNPASVIYVFPNPTSDKMFIESTEPIKEVTVFNISGELILKEKNSSEINLSNLKTGLYMITIETESQIIHSKIIKE